MPLSHDFLCFLPITVRCCLLLDNGLYAKIASIQQKISVVLRRIITGIAMSKAKILFKLNGVPDDEADDVRLLLTDNHIDFYETSAGNWGVSMPAIWLSDAGDYDRARALLDEYQAARTIRMRAEYERLKREGKQKTMIDAIKEKPALILFNLLVAVLVIYVSIRLVIDIGTMTGL